MTWDSIISDVISGTILLLIGAIGGWIGGLSNGKKKSSLAIERKKAIYQPLLDELIVYSNFKWDIFTEIKATNLFEIVNNQYKYGMSDELQRKCIDLSNLIIKYFQITPENVAHSIIVQIFEDAYAEIYGSVIEGISYHSDRDGNEWEEEVVAEPITFIQRFDYSKEILSLLINENMYSDEVCVDYENNFYEPIYAQLKNIYASALYVNINEGKYEIPTPKFKLNMLPEEYIALNYNFFQIYNADAHIIDKYNIREEIIYLSQSIIQNLKEIIEGIVKVYEVEQI